MLLTLDKERRVRPLVQTPFNELNAEISPDGRWLAYESNESGQYEIYVRPFPDATSGRWQITNGGGTRPLWARNGQELFYLAPAGALMAVRVARGPTFTASVRGAEAPRADEIGFGPWTVGCRPREFRVPVAFGHGGILPYVLRQLA